MEGTPQKPQSCRLRRARSFCGGHFRGSFGFAGSPAFGTAEMEGTPVEPGPFAEAISTVPLDLLDFRLLGPPKWRKPHRVRSFCGGKQAKGAISEAPSDLLDLQLSGPPKWREHHKSPKVVDFVESAPFAETISTVSLDLDFRLLGPPKWRKPHRIRSFCGSHFRGPFGFAGFPAFGTAEMQGTPQKPKSCRFCRVRSFCGSHFNAPFASEAPSDLLDLQLLGPPKWREHHKSPKVVDFVESAPFAETISTVPLDLLDFRLLGPPKWRKPHRIRSFCGSHFRGPFGFAGFPAFGTAEMQGTPQKPKSCRLCRVRSFCGSHFQSPFGFAGCPASGALILVVRSLILGPKPYFKYQVPNLNLCAQVANLKFRGPVFRVPNLTFRGPVLNFWSQALILEPQSLIWGPKP